MDDRRRTSPPLLHSSQSHAAYFSSPSASAGTSTCCNSDAGGLEEQRSCECSGAGSPMSLDEEKARQYMEWTASQQQQEQLHQQGHKRKVSDLPRMLHQRLQSHLPSSAGVKVTPSRARLLLKVLIGLCSLLVLSALLPASSPLSIWHRANSSRFRDAQAPDYGWQNEKMAAGKGWGWGLSEDMKGAEEPVTAAKQQANDLGYEQPPNHAAALPDIPCQLDVAAFASRYRLTPKFKYSRRYVTAAPEPPSKDKPHGYDPKPRELEKPIVEGWQTMAWHGSPIEEACRGQEGNKMRACIAKQQRVRASRLTGAATDDDSAPVTAPGLTHLSSCSSSLSPLHIPTYPIPRTHTQPDHVILGLASDADRLFEMMPILSYSFAHSNLHLVLNLPKHPRIPELRKTLRLHSIRATIILSPEEDYLRRWVELPSLLLDFADPGITRWAMVADDDTFFLSLPKLFQMLDKYDADEAHYVGALTDDWRQAGSGMIAYGGAGVLLSMPLLQQLSPHWSECRQLDGAGDHRLATCVYTHTHARLSIEWGLHQTDLYDDVRGMLESGRDIVTWHHWKSWSTGLNANLLSRAGAACGSECLLQRFLSASSNGSQDQEAYHFVHGLSLTLHPQPLPDFSKTELTWKIWANSDFSHSVGPTRPRIREGRPPLSRYHGAAASQQRAWKETWLLEDVRQGEELGPADSWDNDGRGIREIYIKRSNRPRGYVSADVEAEEEDDASDASAEARRHAELQGSLGGLVDRLLGKTMSEEERARVVEEEMEEEEQDSVVELVWV